MNADPDALPGAIERADEVFFSGVTVAILPPEHRETLVQRIGRIIPLPLHERLDVGWREQPNVMAQLADLTTPEMSAAAASCV